MKGKEDACLGIRNMELVNLSLVTKLVWRFLTNQQAVWVQMFHAKYLRHISFWDYQIKPGDSNTWKDMMTVRNIFVNNCCWFIGSGNNIHVWNDPWIPNLPGFRPSRLHNASTHVTWVSQLFVQGQRIWNMDLLLELFPLDQAEIISQIYIPQDEEIQDQLIWLKTPSGQFTTKSCYKLLSDNNPTTSSLAEFPWKKFWKQVQSLPKIKNFVWKSTS